jgi:hypothetical protein
VNFCLCRKGVWWTQRWSFTPWLWCKAAMKSTEFLSCVIIFVSVTECWHTLTSAVHIVLHDSRPSLSQGMTKLELWLIMGSSAIVFLNTPQWHSSPSLKQNDTTLSPSVRDLWGKRRNQDAKTGSSNPISLTEELTYNQWGFDGWGK